MAKKYHKYTDHVLYLNFMIAQKALIFMIGFFNFKIYIICIYFCVKGEYWAAFLDYLKFSSGGRAKGHQ